MSYKIDVDQKDVTFINGEGMVIDVRDRKAIKHYKATQREDAIVVHFNERFDDGVGRIVSMSMVDYHKFSGNVYKFKCSKDEFETPLYLIIDEIKIWERI